MKILVTGAHGFIGQNLTRYLEEKNYEVFSMVRREYENTINPVVCDITDDYLIRRKLKELKPDAIVHLAGNPSTKLCNENPTLITKENVIGTQNLLHNAPEGCRFIFASSITVYGNQMGEEHLSIAPTSVYGATKAAGEALVRAYSELGCVDGISLRLTANVGRYATHGLMFDIFRKLLDENNKELELFGSSPGTSKPFTYVQDTCRAIEFYLLKNGKNPKLREVNISPRFPTKISVLDVAKEVMKITEIEKPIKFLGEETIWKGDNKQLTISSARMLLDGFEPICVRSEDSINLAVKDIYVNIVQNR